MQKKQEEQNGGAVTKRQPFRRVRRQQAVACALIKFLPKGIRSRNQTPPKNAGMHIVAKQEQPPRKKKRHKPTDKHTTTPTLRHSHYHHHPKGHYPVRIGSGPRIHDMPREEGAKQRTGAETRNGESNGGAHPCARLRSTKRTSESGKHRNGNRKEKKRREGHNGEFFLHRVKQQSSKQAKHKNKRPITRPPTPPLATKRQTTTRCA